MSREPITTPEAGRPRRCLGLPIVLLLLMSDLLAACHGDQGGGPGGDVPIFLDLPEVEAEEVGSIGVAEGPAELSFGRITGAAFGDAGEVFVLDGQAREVRVFDPDGAFVRRIGGPGQGPGELGPPHWVWSYDGRVTVLDGNWRMTTFTSGGELLESRRLPSRSGELPLGLPLGRAFPIHPAGGERATVGVTIGTASRSEIGAEVAVVTIDDDGAVDTVAAGASGDVFFRSPSGHAAMGSPFCDAVHGSVAPTGDLFVADGSSGTLTRFRWTRTGLEAGDAWTLAEPGSPPSPDIIRELRAQVPEPFEHPEGEFVPPGIESRICDLLIGPDERVWIRLRDQREGELWGAFVPSSGAPAALVRFPAGATVRAFGGTRAAAVVQDDLGVQTIRVYRMPDG